MAIRYSEANQIENHFRRYMLLKIHFCYSLPPLCFLHSNNPKNYSCVYNTVQFGLFLVHNNCSWLLCFRIAQLLNINVGQENYCQWLEGSRNQWYSQKISSSLEPLYPLSSINPLDQPTEDNIYHQTTYPNAEFRQADYEPKTLLKKKAFLKFWTMKRCIKTMQNTIYVSIVILLYICPII